MQSWKRVLHTIKCCWKRPGVERSQLGPKAQPNCQRSTLADFGRQLVSTIPVDSERILAQDRCHWKLYDILLPTIYRTSKTDYVCDLGVRFIAHCSWTPNWTRTWIAFDLHLGDSNRINLGPPCWLGNPCWTSSTSFHAPIMVVCMGVMSSSFSPSWLKAVLGVDCIGTDPAQHKSERGFENQRNQNYCEEEWHHVSNWWICHFAYKI
jgi:hypothetical protein